jgi:hypothetical protein
VQDAAPSFVPSDRSVNSGKARLAALFNLIGPRQKEIAMQI